MSGDLVKWLKDPKAAWAEMTNSTNLDAYVSWLEQKSASAATLIEAQAAEIERIAAEREADIKRLKVQRDNALLDMEAFMNRTETAERALAEAVEVIDRLSSFQIAETHARTGKLSDLCKAWIDHKKAARNFVKEHGK